MPFESPRAVSFDNELYRLLIPPKSVSVSMNGPGLLTDASSFSAINTLAEASRSSSCTVWGEDSLSVSKSGASSQQYPALLDVIPRQPV